MLELFRAIYEQGVLRPLDPLDVAESAEVECALIVRDSPNRSDRELPQADAQRQARDAMFAAVDQLPQTPVSDGLHGRDHDQILYGGR